ncbi:hypothetical protein PO909_031991, partial [Leuciscus waleckii]
LLCDICWSQVNAITPVAWKTSHKTSKAYSRLCGRTAAAIKLHHPGAKTAIWLLFVENGMGHLYSCDAESEQTQFFLTATECCLKELN